MAEEKQVLIAKREIKLPKRPLYDGMEGRDGSKDPGTVVKDTVRNNPRFVIQRANGSKESISYDEFVAKVNSDDAFAAERGLTNKISLPDGAEKNTAYVDAFFEYAIRNKDLRNDMRAHYQQYGYHQHDVASEMRAHYATQGQGTPALEVIEKPIVVTEVLNEADTDTVAFEIETQVNGFNSYDESARPSVPKIGTPYIGFSGRTELSTRGGVVERSTEGIRVVEYQEGALDKHFGDIELQNIDPEVSQSSGDELEIGDVEFTWRDSDSEDDVLSVGSESGAVAVIEHISLAELAESAELNPGWGQGVNEWFGTIPGDKKRSENDSMVIKDYASTHALLIDVLVYVKPEQRHLNDGIARGLFTEEQLEHAQQMAGVLANFERNDGLIAMARGAESVTDLVRGMLAEAKQYLAKNPGDKTTHDALDRLAGHLANTGLMSRARFYAMEVQAEIVAPSKAQTKYAAWAESQTALVTDEYVQAEIDKYPTQNFSDNVAFRQVLQLRVLYAEYQTPPKTMGFFSSPRNHKGEAANLVSELDKLYADAGKADTPEKQLEVLEQVKAKLEGALDNMSNKLDSWGMHEGQTNLEGRFVQSTIHALDKVNKDILQLEQQLGQEAAPPSAAV